MRAWTILLSALLCGCAASSQTGSTSTPDTVFSDFDACDQADPSPGIDALIDRCSRALNSGLMPEDPTATALIRRGNLYSFKGDYARARQDYEQVLALKPQAAVIPGNLAVIEVLEGDVAAFKHYDSVVWSTQYNSSGYLARGIAWRRIGDYDKAIADFTKALSFRPHEARILVNRGFAYLAKGEYELALADLDKAQQSEPDFLPNEIELAKTRGAPDDLDRAVPGHDYEIILKPDYFLLERTRGFALFMLGRSREAADVLQEYQKIQPGDTVAEIMFLLAAYRSYDQMLLSNIDEATDQSWPKPIRLYLRGELTREELLKAAGADPQRECSARFYFGEADLTGKRRDAAKAEFQRAVAICPKGAFEGAAAAVELARL
jgi:lipoprotein NlpI